MTDDRSDARGMLEQAFEHTMQNRHEIEYLGFTLRKKDWPQPEHTEYAVLNPDGNEVESFTLGAFQRNHDDGVAEVLDQIEAMAECEPDSISDWVNRDRGDA